MNKFKLFSLLTLFVMSMMAVSAQESDKVAITLERTACFGACPVYTVKILENGTVIYNGERFVDVTGEQQSEIDPETVALMVEEIEKAGYFDWNEAYDTMTISDLPSVITSVSRNGETHQITRYGGDSSAPLALPFIEQWIDAMANTQLWTGVQPDISTVSNGTESAIIGLEHGACFGFCPVYNVALFADGTAVYMGIANVDTMGVTVLHLDESAVTSIAQRAQIFGYFNWNDSYEERLMTDQITVISTILWENEYKRIVRYDGDPNAPIGLVRIEESIDQLVMDLVGSGS